MKRRVARELAVASLYQMEMNEVNAQEAIAMLIEEAQGENEIAIDLEDFEPNSAFLAGLVDGVTNHLSQIDGMLQDLLTGWNVDRLSRVDRQVLRLACYEIKLSGDVPPKAAVNEAIELAKHFGTEESGKFVNGVLGRLMQEDSMQTVIEDEGVE